MLPGPDRSGNSILSAVLAEVLIMDRHSQQSELQQNGQGRTCIHSLVLPRWTPYQDTQTVIITNYKTIQSKLSGASYSI